METPTERKKRIDDLYSQDPVKRGLIYCSPWCGYNCKITEFDAAGIKAKALADRLGDSWRPYVWENLGWHYAAVTDSGFHMMEQDYRKTKFSDGFGRLSYSLTTGTEFSSSGDTPEEAIQNVLDLITQKRDKLNQLYNHGWAALK